MQKVTTYGLDIAKEIFHLVGEDGSRKKLRRKEVLAFLAQKEPGLVALEACGSAHYWAREIRACGHEVKLLPPQHVKAYLRGQKNDYNDATAIAEAALVGRIRSVPIKSVDQQAQQAMVNSRRQLVGQRTQLIAHLRSLLYEFGITVKEGRQRFSQALTRLVEDNAERLPLRVQHIIARQKAQLMLLDDEVDWYTMQVEEIGKTNEDCQRLKTIPGLGDISGVALQTWLGDGKQFRCGRDASAALGVVPRQHSSGGKNVLGGISKSGDAYVRCLVIHGARAVVRLVDKREDRLGCWIKELIARRGKHKAIVALANKIIRMAWVVLTRKEPYDPEHVHAHA